MSIPLSAGARWIRFLRQYGPATRNDNMYDEHIRRSAKRCDVRTIVFAHPLEAEILALYRPDARPPSVVLTGTAGDGKTYLCRQIWSRLGGEESEWDSDDIYHKRQVAVDARTINIHVIRDLTALPQQDPKNRYTDKNQLLLTFCQALLSP